ncbi:MAG: glucodextranase DOMON-like domain-containing protein [Ignavibacteriaceae bacterium]
MKKLVVTICFLCFNTLLIGGLNTQGFNFLKKGQLKKSLQEFRTELENDSCSFDKSNVMDALIKYSMKYPKNYKVDYIIGKLCAGNNFKYDADLYLNKFIKYSPKNDFTNEAQEILDTLKISPVDLEYCNFISNYLDKIKRKNNNLKKYWDENVIKRFGNNFDYNFLYNDYKENFESTLFTPIHQIIQTKDYTEIKAGEFSYCIIKVKSKLKLSYPLFLITKNWFKQESKHFIYHCKNKNDLSDSTMMKKMDSFYTELAQKFNVNKREKINYYKCDDAETIGKLLLQSPAYGYTIWRWYTIASVIWGNFHEMVHIITAQKINFNSSLFGEGIAVYYAGTTYFSRDFAISWAQDLALLNKLPPISIIYLNKNFHHSKYYDINDNYFTAGAFTKYLIENYGIKKYITLNNNTAENLIPQKMKKVYNKDVYSMEKDFIQWLLNSKFPKISPNFNNKAKEIFSMDDPEGDDNGDGTYKYPTDPLCKKGVFDLTQFKVLSDANNYYFSLKFRNLVDMDSVSWGFYRTFACIWIKTNKSNLDTVTSWYGNVKLQGRFDYVIAISDKGIDLYDYSSSAVKMMELYNATGKKFGDTTNKEIKFAVSKELLNKISSSSGFVVGIGASDLESGFGEYSGVFVGHLAKFKLKANNNFGESANDTKYEPYFYDILLPKTMNQQELLGSYADKAKTKVILKYLYNNN